MTDISWIAQSKMSLGSNPAVKCVSTRGTIQRIWKHTSEKKTGDRRQETRDRSRKTGDRRRETRDARPESEPGAVATGALALAPLLPKEGWQPLRLTGWFS